MQGQFAELLSDPTIAPLQARRSRLAQEDCFFKKFIPSPPSLISIPQTELLSLRLYDCVPALGIRFDAAVDR